MKVVPLRHLGAQVLDAIFGFSFKGEVRAPFGGSGFRVQGSGFRVQGSGFSVQGSGFTVQGSKFTSPPLLLSEAVDAIERGCIRPTEIWYQGELLLDNCRRGARPGRVARLFFQGGGARYLLKNFKPTCLTHSILGPCVVQIWSRYAQILTR